MYNVFPAHQRSWNSILALFHEWALKNSVTSSQSCAENTPKRLKLNINVSLSFHLW